MKKLIILGILLIASLMFAGQAFADIPYGTATIDGNLSDWAGATWNPFDTVYDSAPVDIIDGEWSARWTPDKVYIAVKVRDTAHIFTDQYGSNPNAWAERDAVELYIHTTGTVGGYSDYEEVAQQWTCGMKSAANGSMWGTIGYPPGYPAPNPVGVDYVPTADQLVVAGSIDGEWLYYEAAITPLEYFGGLRGNPDIISLLSAGDTIGLDVTAVSNDGVSASYGVPGYAGMKCSQLGQANIGGWSANYTVYAQQTLGPVTYTATFDLNLGDFGGDPTGIPVVVDITGSDAVQHTLNAVLDADGKFAISNLAPDDYTISIKPSRWLRHTVPGLVTINSDVSFTYSHVYFNGDCDGDNEVTSTDLSVILTAMDALEGDPTWDATADLDGDGEITSTDLSVVLSNMDMLGD